MWTSQNWASQLPSPCMKQPPSGTIKMPISLRQGSGQSRAFVIDQTQAWRVTWHSDWTSCGSLLSLYNGSPPPHKVTVMVKENKGKGPQGWGHSRIHSTHPGPSQAAHLMQIPGTHGAIWGDSAHHGLLPAIKPVLVGWDVGQIIYLSWKRTETCLEHTCACSGYEHSAWEVGQSPLFLGSSDSGHSGGHTELGLQTYNPGIMPRTACHPTGHVTGNIFLMLVSFYSETDVMISVRIKLHRTRTEPRKGISS